MSDSIVSMLSKYSAGQQGRQVATTPYESIISLWSLRILVHLGGHREFIQRVGWSDDDLLRGIGLGDLVDSESPRPQRLRALRQRLVVVERDLKPKKLASTVLFRNLAELAGIVGLDPVEVEILAFAVLVNTSETLRDACGTLKVTREGGELHKVIGNILNVAPDSVAKALRKNSLLYSSGLLEAKRVLGPRCDIDDLLAPIDHLQDVLYQKHDNPIEMLDKFFCVSSSPRLSRADIPHLELDYDRILCYLREAIATRVSGVNVLLYGPVGTGKTQLSRTLAEELKLPLYEVRVSDEGGDSYARDGRLQSYRLSQHVLRKGIPALVMFDEIEDVFPSEMNFFGMSMRRNSEDKGWVNQMLESNPVPTIWISNEIEQMDPAYLRRFDYIMEVAEPTRVVRSQLIRKQTSGLDVSEQWISRMAEHDKLAPAIVERAAHVARVSQPENQEATEQLITSTIRNTLEAMGHSAHGMTAAAVPVDYSLDYLNPATPLAPIVEALNVSRQGRLCLYGVPGTGKTAFGHHLARELDMPLLIERISDIQSMWVGETEKNVARMFRKAERENAILLIDEADSILRTRADARASWEATQVNEMLSQMECFAGIFIASTNLKDDLDPAVLRRFDAKIRFDYMKAEQSFGMFRALLEKRGQSVPTKGVEDWQALLAKMTLLTPGDFANVARQAEFFGLKLTPASLLEKLQDEIDSKPEGRRRGIGFSATLN